MQIKVGVEVCAVDSEMLDAFPVDMAKFSVVLAGVVALDDDEPRNASLEVETKVSIKFLEEVAVNEGRLWLILLEEAVVTVVAMVEMPETDKWLRAVEGYCDDAATDGPDVDPERVENDDARFSADLGVLTEDCEDVIFEWLYVWLEDFAGE